MSCACTRNEIHSVAPTGIGVYRIFIADTFELRGGVKRYPLDDPIRVNLPSFIPEYQ